MPDLPQLENLARVAATLRRIPERFVFAGASILPMLLDRDFARPIRRTEDTDVVVSVLHYREWSRLRDALIAHGFVERADDRAARQILFWLGDLAVDFIPARMTEFGTENHWLSLGLDLAEPDETVQGEPILRLSSAAWLAAKIAAFERRGRADPMMSRDLEDIVTLTVGRRLLVEDVRISPIEIQRFVATTFRAWSEQQLLQDAAEWFALRPEDRRSFVATVDRLSNPG